MAAVGFQTFPALCAVAMANDEELGRTGASNPQVHAFVVKNTFIDVADDNSPKLTRRSTSAPPSAGRTLAEFGGEVVDDGRRQSVAPAKASSTAWSNASTSEHGDEDEIASLMEGSPSSIDDDTLENTEPLTQGMQLLPVENLSLPPPRAKLSSKANAWAPNRPAEFNVRLPQGVRDQFVRVVCVVQATLRMCAQVGSVSIAESGGQGWTVHGSMQATHVGTAQQALSVVQRAVLTAARGANVHIVGSAANPFTTTAGGFGFAAKLAVVQDERSVCWDLLKTGFCQRASACRWQHPAWQAAISVTLSCAPR